MAKRNQGIVVHSNKKITYLCRGPDKAGAKLKAGGSGHSITEIYPLAFEPDQQVFCKWQSDFLKLQADYLEWTLLVVLPEVTGAGGK